MNLIAAAPIADSSLLERRNIREWLLGFIPVLCLTLTAIYWFLPFYFTDIIPSSREELTTWPYRAFFLLQVLVAVIIYSRYQSSARSFSITAEQFYLITSLVFLSLALGLVRVLRGDGANLSQLGILALSGIIGIGLSRLRIGGYESHLISPAALVILVSALLIGMGSFYKNAFDANAVLLVPSTTLGGLPRPQVTQVLTSTEVSNMLASLFLLLSSYYRYYVLLRNKSIWGVRGIQVTAVITLLLFLLCGSVGGIAALMLVVVLSSKSKSKSLLLFILGVSTIFMGVLFSYGVELSNQPISTEAFVAKFTDEERSNLYPHALRLFLENFYTGIGESRLVYALGMWPHNNILALGGSFGFLAVLIYLGIMLITLYVCGTVGKQADRLSFLAAASITISVFLILKGFVHDTWFDPMIWVGAGSAGALLLGSQRQEKHT